MPIRSSSILLASLIACAGSAAASEVRVWGDASYVSTYDPAQSIFTVPPILATKDVVDIAVGSVFAAALTSDKQIITWGSSATALHAAALAVPSSLQGHAVKVVVWGVTGFALTDAGDVVGWGDNSRSIVSGIPTGLSGNR